MVRIAHCVWLPQQHMTPNTPNGSAQVPKMKIVIASVRVVYATLATSHILLKKCLNTAGVLTLLVGFPCFITNQYDHSEPNKTKTCGPFTDMFLCEKLVSEGHPCTSHCLGTLTHPYPQIWKTVFTADYTNLPYCLHTTFFSVSVWNSGTYPNLRVCDQTSCVQGQFYVALFYWLRGTVLLRDVQ